VQPAAAQFPKCEPTAFKVTRVFPGTTAALQGLLPGDLILSVNGYPVRSGPELRLRLQQAGHVAVLDLIHPHTGQYDRVPVYPVLGKIGVDGCTVPLPRGRDGGILHPLAPTAQPLR
jgi:membrane-associated protease RseP (regulator of RpoE activity)